MSNCHGVTDCVFLSYSQAPFALYLDCNCTLITPFRRPGLVTLTVSLAAPRPVPTPVSAPGPPGARPPGPRRPVITAVPQGWSQACLGAYSGAQPPRSATYGYLLPRFNISICACHLDERLSRRVNACHLGESLLPRWTAPI